MRLRVKCPGDSRAHTAEEAAKHGKLAWSKKTALKGAVMPVVLSDRDAEKIEAELRRHRFGIAALADDAYRAQWLQMVDRLISKLGQRVPSASDMAPLGSECESVWDAHAADLYER